MIFDLDGTLIDHVGSVTTALEQWLPELGASLTDKLSAAWFEAEDKHFPAWRSREVTFAEQRRRRPGCSTGLGTSPPVALAAEAPERAPCTKMSGALLVCLWQRSTVLGRDTRVGARCQDGRGRAKERVNGDGWVDHWVA